MNYLMSSVIIGCAEQTAKSTGNSPGMLILWAVCSLIVFILIHSVFNITYFSSKGCLSEIITCGFIGAIIAGLAWFLFAKYWYIFIGIGILIAVIAAKNRK